MLDDDDDVCGGSYIHTCVLCLWERTKEREREIGEGEYSWPGSHLSRLSYADCSQQLDFNVDINPLPLNFILGEQRAPLHSFSLIHELLSFLPSLVPLPTLSSNIFFLLAIFNAVFNNF